MTIRMTHFTHTLGNLKDFFLLFLDLLTQKVKGTKKKNQFCNILMGTLECEILG